MLVKEKFKIKVPFQKSRTESNGVDDEFSSHRNDMSGNEYIKYFRDGSKLIIHNNDRVDLLNNEGVNCLNIESTESRLIVNINGLEINISSLKSIKLEADFISLNSRSEIEMYAETRIVNTCNGNVENKISGSFIQTASENKITSDLGDILLKANDNVVMLGEKVLLNCE